MWTTIAVFIDHAIWPACRAQSRWTIVITKHQKYFFDQIREDACNRCGAREDTRVGKDIAGKQRRKQQSAYGYS